MYLYRCRSVLVVRKQIEVSIYTGSTNESFYLYGDSTMLRKNVLKPKLWQKVVAIDQKKFNFDGTGGLRYYCHDLRSVPFVKSST